jgi:hypothetical protein
VGAASCLASDRGRAGRLAQTREIHTPPRTAPVAWARKGKRLAL